MVLTDYFGGYGYQDADRLIRNGNDLCLAPNPLPESIPYDQESAASVLAMGKAVKNILYTTANSAAYEEDVAGGLPGWQRTLYTVSGIILAAAALCEVLVLRGYFRKRKAS